MVPVTKNPKYAKASCIWWAGYNMGLHASNTIVESYILVMTYIHTYKIHTDMYACIHACIHGYVHMYVHIHMYVHMYVHKYVQAHSSLARTHAYIHTHERACTHNISIFIFEVCLFIISILFWTLSLVQKHLSHIFGNVVAVSFSALTQPPHLAAKHQ